MARLRPMLPTNTTFAMARAIVLVMLTSLMTSACAMDNTTFDKEQWVIEGKKGPEHSQRWKQMEALRNAIRTGMARTDVLELLGEPDESRHAGTLPYIDVYDVGVPPYGVDMASYELEYKDGLLVRMDLVRL